MMLPKPALKTTNAKTQLFLEALNSVRIGSSLLEPTCLFFPREEAKTPTELPNLDPFTSERKPSNPKKSQYCSLTSLRSPLVTTVKKRDFKAQEKDLTQMRLRIVDREISLTPSGVLVKPSTRFKEFNFASRPPRQLSTSRDPVSRP